MLWIPQCKICSSILSFSANYAAPQEYEAVTCDILMGVGSQSRMYIHCQAIQLGQGVHGAEKHDDNAPAFHSLNCPREKVWGKRFEVLGRMVSLFLLVIDAYGIAYEPYFKYIWT